MTTDQRELAITLPVDVVERLLEAVWCGDELWSDQVRAAVGIVEREIEQVKRGGVGR